MLHLNSGPPQFHTPLKSTSPQFNTSVQHKRTTPFKPQKSLRYTPKTLQFNTPLNSTSKTPQFHTKIPKFHTKNPSIQHTAQFNTPLSSTPKTPTHTP